mmetsp:Transcript_124295/g.397914  ORF Transcript_124295/g.397914 Transcript_124295/m.397914 type:complete len:220 (-) Transcript_124295:2360-3019(-)
MNTWEVGPGDNVRPVVNSRCEFTGEWDGDGESTRTGCNDRSEERARLLPPEQRKPRVAAAARPPPPLGPGAGTRHLRPDSDRSITRPGGVVARQYCCAAVPRALAVVTPATCGGESTICRGEARDAALAAQAVPGGPIGGDLLLSALRTPRTTSGDPECIGTPTNGTQATGTRGGDLAADLGGVGPGAIPTIGTAAVTLPLDGMPPAALAASAKATAAG